MKSTPPFVAQGRPDSCAIACLRMLLARRGREVLEDELVQASDMQPGGLDPDELRALARDYGLAAEVRQVDFATLSHLLADGRFPIAYVYRGPIDNVGMTHAVIPLRIGRTFVTVLDPLRGERRISIRKFEHARRMVGYWILVCD